MITAQEKIGDLIKKYPEAIRVFSKYGLGCIGCHASGSETIEEAAQVHGIDLESFLSDINKIVPDNNGATEQN